MIPLAIGNGMLSIREVNVVQGIKRGGGWKGGEGRMAWGGEEKRELAKWVYACPVLVGLLGLLGLGLREIFQHLFSILPCRA